MDQVEEIKQKVDIAQLVGEYVVLKKAGRHWKGLCPFHNEKTPSFIVSEEMGIYKCFGCAKGGDAINFLMEIEGLEFREALERLAERVGVELKFERKEERTEKETLLEIHALAADYYNYLLTSHAVGEKAREYLKGRGINEKLINNFRLGFSLSEWDGLSRFLAEKKGYEKEMLVRAGLAIEREGRIYDRFRGRLMFPLLDSGGKVVGFSGRVIPGIGREDEPKYVNSPETEIYHKSRMLFGLSLVKQAMRESKRVVVVEGELDMISSYAAGVTETVAIKGSALTEEMIEMLARLVDKVVLALDADAAGEAAMKRSIQAAENRGLGIKIALITGGKDPDEIARKNPKLWRKAVDEAVEAYEFVMTKSLEKNGVNSVEAIKKVVGDVVPYLAGIENSVVREVWVRRLAASLGVDKERVWEEVEKKRGGGRDLPTTATKGEVEDSRLKKMVRRLLGMLFISDVEYRKKVKKILEGIELTEAEGKLLWRWLETEMGSVDEWIKQLPSELKVVAEEAYLMDEEQMGESGVINMTVEVGREVLKAKRRALVEQMRLAESGQKTSEEAELSEKLVAVDKQEQRLLAALV